MGFLIDKTLSYSNFSHLSAVKRVECNLYKIAFGFQIYKGIPINEHIRMKPNKFSTQDTLCLYKVTESKSRNQGFSLNS